MHLGPVELYKKLPKTNCGDCGQPSCFAFATMVIGHGVDLGACVHLDGAVLQEVSAIIERQREKGIYVKRDKHKVTRDHLRDKIRNHDFRSIASGLGASYSIEEGVQFLKFPYFGSVVTLGLNGINGEETEDLDPWDEILLFNYIYFSGSKPLSGSWVGMESFPNSISKRAALEDACHQRISNSFAGDISGLAMACCNLGGTAVTEGHNADLAYRLWALPRLPVLLLFWDKDDEEGFEARTKLLFDASATEYLDLEGLSFVAEKVANKLISKRKEERNV